MMVILVHTSIKNSLRLIGVQPSLSVYSAGFGSDTRADLRPTIIPASGYPRSGFIGFVEVMSE